MTSVVIHGPNASDMTVNAQRLRRKFGLQHLVVDVQRWAKTVPADTLLLTHTTPPAHVYGQARVMSFSEAMRIAGFSRSPA